MHPVPYWDMWDGYLSFWFELQDGNTAIWWELSNEHHLVLLKAIFWVDLTLLAGSQSFLVAVNLFVVAGIAAALVTILYQRLTSESLDRFSRATFVILSAVLLIVTFSWMQGEELVFPYHAHFLLNVLLPLLAFSSLGVAAKRLNMSRTGVSVSYWIGFSCALLSPWTSASGLFVPFLAGALAALIGLGRARSLALVGLGIVSTLVYSFDSPFVSAGGDGPIGNLIASPIEVLRFWLIYLGGPWAVVTDSQLIGGIAGLGFIVTVIYYVSRHTRRGTRSISGLVAVAYPVFMLISSGITASGRVNLGIEQVTAIRYLTPMLAGWACLLVLAAPRLQAWFDRPVPVAYVGVFLIPVLLLPEQASALTPKQDDLHVRDAAALALALGAPDPEAILPVYPFSTERPIELASRARTAGIGLFADAPYASIRESLGLPVLNRQAAPCVGWVESQTPLEGSPWSRVDGWVVVANRPVSGGIVTLTDRMAQTIGWVAVGKPRNDVAAALPEADGLNGFTGYVQTGASPGDIFVAGESFRCGEPLSSAIP